MIDITKIPLACDRDTPDDRDFRKFSAAPPIELPETFDVPAQPAIRNQGITNACTGFSSAWMWQQILNSRGMGEDVALSAYYAWYYARLADGNEGDDTGAQIRNAMKGLKEHGCCTVEEWSEDSQFDIEPYSDAKIWGEALSMPSYERLESVRAIKYAVAIEQQSVVIGLPIYEAWYQNAMMRNGIVPARAQLGPLVGWHAMVVTGYTKERLILANSWSKDYGSGGYVFVPFDYLDWEETDDLLGFDAWTAGFDSVQDFPSPNAG